MVFGIFRGTSTSRSHPAKYSPLWTPYQDAFLTTQTADDNPDEFNEVQKDLLREVLRRRRMEYLSLLLGLICGILVVVVGFLLFGSKEFQIRAPVVEFAPASK